MVVVEEVVVDALVAGGGIVEEVVHVEEVEMKVVEVIVVLETET